MTQGHLEGFAPRVKAKAQSPVSWGACPGCGVVGWRRPGRACPGCGWSPGVGLALGRKLRGKALDTHEMKRGTWLAMARAAARAIALGRADRRACTDDVHRACPVPPGVNPKVMGAVFRGKEWEADGTVQTVRPVAHARPIRWWRLTT